MCQLVDVEELEALAAGKLDVEAAARVSAHVAGCAECKEELEWLQAEAELMARRRQRQDELDPALWSNVAARIAEPKAAPVPIQSARRWSTGARVAYGGLLAAAAAAVVMATWTGQPNLHHSVSGRDAGGLSYVEPPTPSKKEAPQLTLDRAEKEYHDAAKVLEAEYAEERSRLPPSVAERYDRMLAETRTRVADAREVAGNDVEGRMVVLDGYAEYLRSLQTIVTDIR
jgi:hypothetical protein